LTTPEHWDVKKQSDEIYEAWRKVTDVTKLSRLEHNQFKLDMNKPNEMWNQLWTRVAKPDFSIFDTSSIDNTLPFIKSSKVYLY